MHKDPGGWKQRATYGPALKAFLPLIGPVVMSSLLETRERAMALEVRALVPLARKRFFTKENLPL